MKTQTPPRRSSPAKAGRIAVGKLKSFAAEFARKPAGKWNAAEFLRELRAK